MPAVYSPEFSERLAHHERLRLHKMRARYWVIGGTVAIAAAGIVFIPPTPDISTEVDIGIAFKGHKGDEIRQRMATGALSKGAFDKMTQRAFEEAREKFKKEAGSICVTQIVELDDKLVAPDTRAYQQLVFCTGPKEP